ncbi:antigenic thaumatin domain protein [Penicillium angulare]|uniref:antigenic thaumatin domain protein n=1 Tax=Penicillium angulare TaxID=116970 RepID=UPI002541796E|nr:antigenic thaumatin domain protein [Penicillium angulare]KAJ5291492.1 antigenic thaumatin domain protein [Penicillium angulare]
MKLSIITITWLLVRLAKADTQPGTLIVHNNCYFAVHVQGVADMPYLQQDLKAGETLHLPFRESVSGTGNSLKIATEFDRDNIAQVEYSACFLGSLCFPKDSVFYDLSNIDGNPFLPYGITISPSRNECTTVRCPAFNQHCDLVYYQPHDNQATQGCDVETNLHVELCSG